MPNELLNNKELLEEYDNVFTNDEKVAHALNITKANFSLQIGYVDFDDLSFTEPIKRSRKETYLGLTTSVGELGILNPIHVMVTKGYADYLDGVRDEEFMGFKYVVIDGFRRVFAGKKNGIDGCNAVIWEFEDKDLGSQLVTSLARLLNRSQRHSWAEVWYLYQVLEMQCIMSPGTLEYLLQLDPGDAMKLKDIMMCDYPEVREELMSNKKTLIQCYNMLQKLRKDEDALAMEDQMGLSEVEEAKGIIESSDDSRPKLSDEDVKEILEMADDFDGELSDDDFDEMMGNNIPDERQEVGNRHPLDPALKAETLIRDGYTCQCCGAGRSYPFKYALAILQSHHKISIANSGVDSAENIITVCMSCHTLIHVLLKNNLKFGISKETFDTLPEDDQNRLKNIMKIARVDYEAGRRLGKTREDFKKDNKDSYKFKMPGTDLAENMRALESRKGA